MAKFYRKSVGMRGDTWRWLRKQYGGGGLSDSAMVRLAVRDLRRYVKQDPYPKFPAPGKGE